MKQIKYAIESNWIVYVDILFICSTDKCRFHKRKSFFPHTQFSAILPQGYSQSKLCVLKYAVPSENVAFGSAKALIYNDELLLY